MEDGRAPQKGSVNSPPPKIQTPFATAINRSVYFVEFLMATPLLTGTRSAGNELRRVIHLQYC